MALSSFLSPPSSSPHSFRRLILSPNSALNVSSFPQKHNVAYWTINSASSSSSSTEQRWRRNVSFFTGFLNNKSPKDANAIKEELLDAIASLDRGADAGPEDQERVDKIAIKLEAANPTKEPLKSSLLDGKWELIYTTSRSILQIERPKILRSRTNYQAINVETLRAQNMESWPFFNQVTADLTPLNARKVAVKFDYFKILGLIPVKAPDRARGELEITYLDDELRVSRGDKGNLFILKMIDRSYKIPT
ncbi:probable plastid-lipid-associated protein 4, chloroplastic [Impatiens glandulifera]|uniref:probable plastid-lipid-associated protein 4, chloroplastic n=1 Tax=Impatiens glandulifera TaxID=253017 RepID=UPI001FB0AFEA|nr:probable plastid-lipid-associated protein 4, chloroplastic [Impatiens glandulifera]